jgi:hypothetical protein
MKSFIAYLNEEKEKMTANTILSDINEIQVGFVLNGNKWFDPVAKSAFEARVKQAKPHEVEDAIGKAEVMASEFLKWAKAHGYSGQVKQVWWTAREGELARASKSDADSKKNPTDILVLFTSGPANGYLGLSAKATKTNGEIGFKNPGIGTVDRSLNIRLADEYKNQEQQLIKKFNLPPSAQARKAAIRANAAIKQQTEVIGQQILAAMRDELFVRLNKMSNKELMSYLLKDWMDADILYPPYIKVTGQGNKHPYKAVVMDPTSNEKLDVLAKYPIKLEKVGNESIGVSANGKKIMKMRFKFESEKMASSVKMSGDPW